jgi:hypothetical protein
MIMKINQYSNGHGDVWGELQAVAKRLEGQIADASRQGDRAKIFALAERLRRADAVVQRYETIRQEVGELIRLQDMSATGIPELSENKDSPPNGGQSNDEHPKTRGKRLRTAWIAKNGKGLKHLRRTLYQNSKGETVGIACATEKRGADGPEGRWWLGLPRDDFQAAVLICENGDGAPHAACLPKSFIETYRSRLSKSSGGQEQFTILRNGDKWYLQVPAAGAVEITMYVDDTSSVL